MEGQQQAQWEEVEQITVEHHTSSQDQVRDILHRGQTQAIQVAVTLQVVVLLQGESKI